MGIEERRQREREARQALILDAAEQVIADRGLLATTMDDVAAAAELSKGTLYLYFANKDALCAALAARTIGKLLPELGEAMDRERLGLEKLRVALRVNAHFMGAHPHVVRMAVSWMLTGVQSADSPEFAAYRQRIARTLALALEAIELGQRDGSVRLDAEARSTAVALWFGLMGTLLAAIHPADLAQRLPFVVGSEALVDFYIENALAGLRSSRDPIDPDCVEDQEKLEVGSIRNAGSSSV